MTSAQIDQLALRAKSGDEQALAGLVEPLGGVVKKSAARFYEYRYLREDLEQTGFVVAFAALRSWDPEKGSFLKYAKTSVRNACRKAGFDLHYPMGEQGRLRRVARWDKQDEFRFKRQQPHRVGRIRPDERAADVQGVPHFDETGEGKAPEQYLCHEGGEDLLLFWIIFSRLGNTDQQILRLHLAGYSAAGIGRQLGYRSRDTGARILSTAQSRLRALLGEGGIHVQQRAVAA